MTDEDLILIAVVGIGAVWFLKARAAAVALVNAAPGALQAEYQQGYSDAQGQNSTQGGSQGTPTGG